MTKPKIGGLGRGLDALFEDHPIEKPAIEVSISGSGVKYNGENGEMPHSGETGNSVKYISVLDIKPNVNQPRKTFNKDKIKDLAASIKEHGIIQPIVVRTSDKGYEIVAGERRWRAALEAELKEVPCIVRELDDEENMLLAIIENMQREDLNPIEEAEGINRMIKTFGMTQEQVSRSVGKSRPYITNSLRLLKLPEYVTKEIRNGKISAAHGRTLVNVTDESRRKAIIERIISEGLSVRETEKLAAGQTGKKTKKKKQSQDANLVKLESELKDALGTRVTISNKGKKGKIEIEYFSKEELERLLELLKSLGK